jgi:predicted permease
VALSLVLLVAAGLFVRTFLALATLDPGFVSNRLLMVNITTPMTRVKPEELNALYERVLEEVQMVPGVERAVLSDITPISGSARITPITVPGVDLARPSDGSPIPGGPVASVNVVSPGWFTTYGTKLLGGRDVERQDRLGTPRVAVVNEAFARTFFNGENPIGRTVIDITGADAPIEIVGYAADAVYRTLRDPAPPTMYTAFAQRASARPFVTVTVRTSTDSPAALTRSLAAAVGAASRDLNLQFRTLDDQVGASLAQERVVAMLAAFFGGLALLLAGLGLYGVTAHAVNRRRGEIGIRMALGAARAGIMRLVLTRVAVLVIVGLAVGGVLSWWASRFVTATLLYGLEARDPLTLIGAALILTAVGISAGWIPARRAARIDPMVSLRAE